MLMADVFSVVFVVLGLLLAHAGVWLLARGLFRAHVERAAAQVESGLVVTMLAGVVPFALAFATVAILGNTLGGLGKALAALVASGALLFAHAGLAGAVSVIGKRLGSDPTPWRETARGATALGLAYVFPILGWFVIFPASLILGVGASSIALVRALADGLRRPAAVMT